MSSTMQVTPTASLFPGWPVLTPQDGTIAVDPDLLGKKDGKPAKDISGMDCMPSAAGDVLDCIAVNDENRVAQRVTVKPGSLSPGATVALLGPVPLGRPSSVVPVS